MAFALYNLAFVEKKVLIINYSFPPNHGVGGRRWAKLSKYLANSNVKVYVINASNTSGLKSLWLQDIAHQNIKVFSVKNIFEATNNRFLKKILFTLSKLYLSANYSDQSVWWNKPALRKAIELINENSINNVIVSSPPYHSMHYFLKLKNYYQNLNYIVDYRDLWTIPQMQDGFFKYLPSHRFEKENQMEHEVLNLCDRIVCVDDFLSEALSKKTNKPVSIVPNGFDASDFNNEIQVGTIGDYVFSDKINIIYAGNIVKESNTYARIFFKELLFLHDHHFDLYNKLNIQFFGNINIELKQFIDSLNLSCLSFNKAMPSNALGSLIKHFDFCLLILIPQYLDSFISKFYDYVASKKPIVSVCESGQFADYINLNKIGFIIDTKNPRKTIFNLFSEFSYNHSFDIDQFSYENLAGRYYQLLK